MAAAAVAKSSKHSSDNKENVSPSASNASKPDPAARRPSTDSSTDNIDSPYFRELQRYACARKATVAISATRVFETDGCVTYGANPALSTGACATPSRS
jgi:hypothetical protein